MMSGTNLSLMNPGTSLNIDGAFLQNEQEAECQKEEEQQQNELKQLLTNAFDDLIDDDEFSITSDEGGNSTNVSLHAKDDGTSPVFGHRTLPTVPSQEDQDWQSSQRFRPVAAAPLYVSQAPGLATLYESSSVRSSQENPLRNSQEQVPGTQDSTVRSSQDYLRSSQENPLRASQDALRSSQENPLQGIHELLRSSQENPLRNSQEMLRGSHDHVADVLRNSYENILRRSLENLPSRGEEYHQHYGNAGNQATEGFHSDGYHSNSEPNSMNQVFNQQNLNNPHAYDWIRSTTAGSGGENAPGVPNYPREPDYLTSRFGEVPQRQETEGSDYHSGNYRNTNTQEQSTDYYGAGGYYGNVQQQEDQPRTGQFDLYQVPQSQGYTYSTEPKRYLSHQPSDKGESLQSRGQGYQEDYKVQYKGNHGADGDEVDSAPRKNRPKNPEKQDEETGSDARQYAQLQVLYKARGRKLEEITGEFEILKQETAREIRILKHQVSSTKVEKDGAIASLKQAQEMLSLVKGELADSQGVVKAKDMEIDNLRQAKEELIKKLKSTESTIDNLKEQLHSLEQSETISRARQDHEMVVAGLQQRHRQEVKVLNEKIDKLNNIISDQSSDIKLLQQKLDESRKTAELAQVSRAETINRLTRSLEDSQKQCQTLLESTSSQELSHVRIQLQQAVAARQIADDMCQSYKDEVHDLKEQLSMFESASSLGALSGIHGNTNTHTNLGANHDDSLMELGIKKTLNFDTPDTDSSGQRTGHSSTMSEDIMGGLKRELERCLASNQQKRQQVSDLQAQLRAVKKDAGELQQRCARSEASMNEYKRKVEEWEEIMRSTDKHSAMEARLRKDLDNLTKEKRILQEDVEDLKKRLSEVMASEEKLSEINQDLNKQLSQMVKEFDEDKREALDRCQKNLEAIHELAKEQLHAEFEEKLQTVKEKHMEECNKLRNELNTALKEVDDLKETYVQVCQEKDRIEAEGKSVKDNMMKTFDEEKKRMLDGSQNEKEQMEKKMVKNFDEKLSQKLKELQEKMMEEKEQALKEQKDASTKAEKSKLEQMREKMKKEMDEESKKIIETKIAMAKVEWFEEQRNSKQAAVDKAVKLTESEWKVKLEKSLQTEVDSRVQQAKAQWLAQRKLSLDSELQDQIQKHKDELEACLKAEYDIRRQKEKDQLSSSLEESFKEKLKEEKEESEKRLEKSVSEKLGLQKQLEMTQIEEEFAAKEAELQVNIAAVEKERDELKAELKRVKATCQELEQKLKDLQKQHEDLHTKFEGILGDKKDLESKLQILQKERLKFELGSHKNIEERLQREKDDLAQRFREDMEKLRTHLEEEKNKAVESERIKVKEGASTHKEQEFSSRLDDMKKNIFQKFQDKEDKWQKEKDQEMKEALKKAKDTWDSNLKTLLEENIYHAKQKWEAEFEERLKEEKEKWRQSTQQTKAKEVREVLEQAQREWEDSHNLSLEEMKNVMEGKIQQQISTQVSLAVDDARKEWQKEQDNEGTSNLTTSPSSTSALSQAILREEVTSLKKENSRLQSELRKWEERWTKERKELIMTKDQERRKAERDIQEQYEKDYSKFTHEHQETLSQALKTAREQHQHEKSEMEKRYAEELKRLVDSEYELQQRLRDNNYAMTGPEMREILDQERALWDKEKDRLEAEIQERDALLEQADLHLSNEVEKLRTDMEASYQHRLQMERSKFMASGKDVGVKGGNEDKNNFAEEKKKMANECESIKNTNSKLLHEIEKLENDRKAFSQENQMLKAEVQKVKVQLFGSSKKQAQEVHQLNEKLAQQKKDLLDLEAKEVELTSVKNLLEEQNAELSELKLKYDDLLEQSHDLHKVKAELDRLRSESLGFETEKEKLKLAVKEAAVRANQVEAEKADLVAAVKIIKDENNRLVQEKQELESVAVKLKAEMDDLEVDAQRLREELSQAQREKATLGQGLKDLEAAYRKDLNQQKQRQEEVNTKLKMAERNYKDAKEHYRKELDRVKRSMETENNVAMETMKNKMIEMQKAHLLTVESLKKQYKLEFDEFARKIREKHNLNMSTAEVQTDSEDGESEQELLHLRSQYLETVGKIKQDVMRHIMETNLRAAETVKCEMMQERNTTLTELKRIYMENVRRVLQNEILEANIEAKLADIEDALEVISFTEKGSKDSTPHSSRSSTPTFGKGQVRSRSLPENEISTIRSPRSDYIGSYGNKYPPSSSLPQKTESLRSNSKDYISRSPGRYESDLSPARSEGYVSRTLHKEPSKPLSARSEGRHPTESSSERGHVRTLPPTDKDRTPTGRPVQNTSSRSLDRNRTQSLPGQKMAGYSRTSEKFVTFREASPIMSSTGSEDTDEEVHYTSSSSRTQPRSSKVSEKTSRGVTHHRPVSQYSILPDQNKGDNFQALDPRSRSPSGLDTERKQSSLYKVSSQPELGTTAVNGGLTGDAFHGSYRYTSLRDNLKKGTSPRREGSVSQEDLRLLARSDTANGAYGNKSFSVDIGLENLGLYKTSPRKYNPSPEKLVTSPHSRDAGESPIGTPRAQPRTRSFLSPGRTGSLSQSPGSERQPNLADTDFERKYFGYRYNNPVRNRVDYYHSMASQ